MGCTWMGNVCTCCRKFNNTNVVQQNAQGNATDLEKAVNYVKQGGGNNELTKLIELKFSCKNLPNLDTVTLTDAMCIVQMQNEQNKDMYHEIGRTEIINDNLNPIFVKSINVPYHFELPKRLKISVYDVDDFHQHASLEKHDFVGFVQLLLHDIIGAPNQELEIPLINRKRKKNGTILIQAFEIETKPDHKIKMTMQASNITNNGRLFFYLLRSSQREGKFVRVFKSELQTRDQYNNIHWNIVEVLSSSLANYDFNLELKFQLWQAQKSGSHKFLGSCPMSINEIIDKDQQGKIFNIDASKVGTIAGQLRIANVQTTVQHSFLEYIFGGCQISLMVGIDFTLSNGEPHKPNSLHNFNQRKNEYIKAIKSVGQILQCYDSDKKIPVFGYGAKVPGFDKVSHCFALNGNIFDPQLDQIDGVIECYKRNVKNLKFYGPTHFSQILKEAVDFAQYQKVSQFNQKYYILLMITDGQINDMDKSIDQIVRGSSLPLSVIIVGVGDQDFGNMNVLDADQTPLYSKTLRKQMERDIVQFVPFAEFKDDSHLLTRQTLDQIPGQIVSFFESKGITPLDKTESIQNLPYIPPAPGNNPYEEEIPSYFTEKKIEFLEYLTSIGHNRENLEQLLHYGIPFANPDFVGKIINFNYDNPLLMRKHQQRGRNSIAMFKKGLDRAQTDEVIAAKQIKIQLE